MFKVIFTLLCFFISVHIVIAQLLKELASSCGKLNYMFTLSSESVPGYSVSCIGNPVVFPSSTELNDWEKGFVLSDI
jgi:hypothetical protein